MSDEKHWRVIHTPFGDPTLDALSLSLLPSGKEGKNETKQERTVISREERKERRMNVERRRDR